VVARQGFQRHDLAGAQGLLRPRAVPALHVDTGKKFPEMYAFRDRFGKEWDLDLKVEPCPADRRRRPDLAAAARSAARKTEGLKWR